MKVKPTYEELERRVRELEKIQSELEQLKEEVEKSENEFKRLYEKAPLGYQSLDENGHLISVNQSWLDNLGYTQEEVIGKSFAEFLLPEWKDHFKETFPRFKAIGEIPGVEFEMVKKNGESILVSLTGKISRDEAGVFQQTHCVFQDIGERKRKEEELNKIEWMLSGKPLAQHSADPYYGDLTALNRGGLISRSIDKVALREIASEYLDLLETSSAIYEKNGDYAFGIFCSGWCRLMDSASRELCNTENNEAALASGKWLCHESCWTDCSKRAIESQSPVDIQCSGGIHLYAVPIFCAGEVIGAINFGYGAPPKDAAKLGSLADSYGLDPERLAYEADAYASRPSFVIELAKRRLLSSAGLIGIMVERKLAEESLREQRDFSESLVDTAQVIILVLDTKGRIVRFNPYMEQLVGYALDEVKGKDWFETFLTPEIDRTIKPLFKKTVADVHTSGNVNPIISKDGRSILVEWYNKTLKDNAGRTVGVLAIGQDITERKQSEEELRRRENQLQRIFEILPIGLWFADKDGTLLRGNPKGIEIWGAEPKVPLSEYGVFKAWRLPSRELIEADQWALAQTIRTGETIVDELLEIESFDGKRKTILNYTAPVLDVDGKVDGAIVVNLDISDRIALEKQLVQAQKMESIGRLAGGVAHDFNNMLGAILGYTELAMEQVEPDNPLLTDLEKIQKAAQRSADLTRQLLAFARKQTVAPKVIDLNETVEGMLKLLRRLIGENIDLAWLPGKEVLPVHIDPVQIDQVLANLCVNARDAIAGVGKVTIETGIASLDKEYCAHHAGFIPGEYVLLTVSDNGCGMDEKTKSHIFEPFFTTKEVGEGTGLGLATVYGVVKQNNGFIYVYSEPGQGTTFKIYLPRHLAKTVTSPEKGPDDPGKRGHEAILLVEDEPELLEMTSRMLKRLGYNVLAAGTPGEAVRLAQKQSGRIDLLLTDVVMPEMNGRDLAKNLLSIYPNIRRLFMSGYTANVIAHHGVLDEGVHFIQKPFSMKDLGAKLREVLDD
jgi:PAS domain S-box-containing protein